MVRGFIGIDINEVYISQSPLARERQEVTPVSCWRYTVPLAYALSHPEVVVYCAK